MMTTPPGRTVIDVQHLTKKFGTFVAVDDVAFSVAASEIFGLVGPNGAGKSTLIHILTTLMSPTSGTALIDGLDIMRDPDGVRNIIGVIPQALTSDLELSPQENLIIYAKLYDVPRARRHDIIDELLESVALTQWRDKPVRQLSGGMRRRVEIARGLVHEPRILFLDEPTTGLDPVSRAAVWDMLREIKRKRDLTMLLTTHYMDEADTLCDRVAIVDHGRLMALDSPMELKASLPSRNTIDVSFTAAPGDWKNALAALPSVDDVTGDGHVFRVGTNEGPVATKSILELAESRSVKVESLSVKSTTLDDVFVHFTGRELRDTLQTPSALDRAPILRRL